MNNKMIKMNGEWHMAHGTYRVHDMAHGMMIPNEPKQAISSNARTSKYSILQLMRLSF